MTEITEVPQTPLEVKLRNDQMEVSESLRRIDELTEIKYVPGFENKVGFFPKLEGLEGRPVLARFSYGSEAPNMSAVFFDPNLGKEEGREKGEAATKAFLESQGFTGPTIQVLGKFEGNEAQIEEVDRDTLKEKTKAVGNMVFTRDPEVTLIIKPADCPTLVITGEDDKGNPFVAIDHSGADAANVGITRQSVWYLQNILGTDLSMVKIAIFPGVAQQNYFITKEWETPDGQVKTRDSGIPKINWGPFIEPLESDNPREKRYVDILSAAEMQVLQSGIPAENIQAYRVDTYEDARNGKAFSRRYSTENGNDRPGGNLLAVQLTPKKTEEMSTPLQQAA